MLSPRAQPVGGFVIGDTVQPRRQGCLAPECRQRLPRFDERLLRQVLGIVNAGRQMAQQAVDARVVLRDELLPRLLVAVQDLFDQPTVPHATAHLSSAAIDIEPAVGTAVHGMSCTSLGRMDASVQSEHYSATRSTMDGTRPADEPLGPASRTAAPWTSGSVSAILRSDSAPSVTGPSLKMTRPPPLQE